MADRDPGGPGFPVAEWGRSLLWLCLLGTAVLFSPRTTEAFERPKVAVLQGVALVLASGMLGVAFTGPEAWTRVRAGLRETARDPLAAGAVLTVFVAAVSAVFSISPRTSLLGAQGSFTGLATLAAYAVVFFGARWLCGDPGSARGVLLGAVIGVGVAVVYGAVQLAGLDPFRWEAPIAFASIGRVFSTQGHPNSLSQLLVTGAPLAVFFSLAAARARRFGEATVLGLVAAGAVGLTLLTVSRAGVLALLAAVAAAVWGARSTRKGALAPLVAVALGVGASAALLAVVFDPGGILEALGGRLSGATDPRHLGHDGRRFLWAGAWAAFRDHPVVGVGVDGLSLAFGPYRTAAGWNAEWGETPLKAHNQMLEVLATRGMLGAAAALVALFGLGRAAMRALRAAGAGRGLPVAVVASLAAFGAHNLFHFPTVAGATLAVTLAAVLSRLANDGSSGAEAAPLTVSPRGGLLAVVVAVVAVYALVLVPLRADVLAQAATVIVRTDPPRAAALAREAVRLDPSRDLLWLRLAAALQSEGLATTSPERRKALLDEARRAAERGVSLVPVNAYNQAHLGTLLADLERETRPLAGRSDVEQAFARAAALDPRNPDILVAAANAALAAGDLSRARAWATGCSQLYPRFASPRAVLGAVLLAEGRQRADEGQHDRAREKLVEAAQVLKEALAADWHGDDRARAAAEANLAVALAEGSLRAG